MNHEALVQQHHDDIRRIEQLTKDHEHLADDYDKLHSQYISLRQELDSLKTSLIPHIQSEIAKATMTFGVPVPPKKRGNRYRW